MNKFFKKLDVFGSHVEFRYGRWKDKNEEGNK